METKYVGQKDLVLHALSIAGWADGRKQYMNSYLVEVTIMHLTAEDLGETYLQKIEKLPGLLRERIIGSWIIIERSTGIVNVRKYDDPSEAVEAFDAFPKPRV